MTRSSCIFDFQTAISQQWELKMNVTGEQDARRGHFSISSQYKRQIKTLCWSHRESRNTHPKSPAYKLQTHCDDLGALTVAPGAQHAPQSPRGPGLREGHTQDRTRLCCCSSSGTAGFCRPSSGPATAAGVCFPRTRRSSLTPWLPITPGTDTLSPIPPTPAQSRPSPLSFGALVSLALCARRGPSSNPSYQAEPGEHTQPGRQNSASFFFFKLFFFLDD